MPPWPGPPLPQAGCPYTPGKKEGAAGTETSSGHIHSARKAARGSETCSSVKVAALNSLFGSKPKLKAVVAPKIKVTTKPTVKPKAKTKIKIALPTSASKATAAKKEPVFSFFNKPVAPKMALAAMHTIESRHLEPYG